MSARAASAGKAQMVPCPGCRQPSLLSVDNRWRPFCSQRCAGEDIGAWASEGYRVGMKDSADDTDAGAPTLPPR